MPYYVFHNMTLADADAIVAFLRTVPAVSNAIPARQQLPFPFTQPAAPVPQEQLPNTQLPQTDPNCAAAVRGKYLAATIGACMECHTEESPQGTPVPIDVTQLFFGCHIGHYLTTVTPANNGVIPNCTPLAPTDAGGDGSADGSAVGQSGRRPAPAHLVGRTD